jgi:transcriptional regulator with GAF, ATPase, and Fis domain
MREWLQYTQYAKEQYQKEAEYLNKALNVTLQNHTTSRVTAQNKKITEIPLVLRDYLSYTQTKLIEHPVKLFHKGALQAPLFFDKTPIGEILKERSVCQKSIHEKESFAEQLQQSIQYAESEVQLIQASIQQCGWIRRGCSALLDVLLWRF